MITVQFAKAFPNMRINAVEPGFTKTDINGNTGTQTVEQGAEIIVRMALFGTDRSTGATSTLKAPSPGDRNISRLRCAGLDGAGYPRPARTHPSAPPEVEAVAPGPKSGRLHYIHGQVEVCANAKWLVRIAAERDRIPTLLPPPPHQRV